MLTRLPLIRIGLSREAVPKANSFLANTCGLTEATSKANGNAFAGPPEVCVWAQTAAASTIRIARRPAMHATPALASTSLFARFNLFAMLLDHIRKFSNDVVRGSQ